MTKICIQDVHNIGMRVQQILMRKQLHTRGLNSTAEFQRIWNEAVEEVKAELDAGTIEVIGDTDLIDWALYFEAQIPSINSASPENETTQG